MGNSNEVPLHATLAAQHPADRLGRLISAFAAGQHGGRPMIECGRWLALVLGGAGCAGLLAHRGALAEVVMAAIALASLVSSIAGFAFSAISGGMLFHLMGDPIQVVQLMITCSIANQAMMSWEVRREIAWRGLAAYLSGGALGLVPGAWVLLHADRRLYGRALGAFLLAYAVYMLLRRPMVLRSRHVAFDFGVGFLGGVTGAAAGFPSAPVSIWCNMKGWPKARQRAVVQPFILVMQVAALLAISLAGRPAGAASIGFDAGNLLFIPASLLGTSLGLALYKRLSDGQFVCVVNVLLLLSGLSFIV